MGHDNKSRSGRRFPASAKMAFAIAWLCCLIILAPITARAAIVEGIVLTPSGPADKITVSAAADYASLASGIGLILAKPTQKAGQFRFELPQGIYFFTARGEKNGKTVFAYHGVNPVAVTNNYLWLPFFAVEQKPLVLWPGQGQGIGGRVTYKGKNITSGVVSIYPAADKHFRGMGLLSNTIDEEGQFWFDLNAGTYVIIARQRKNDSTMGPLQQGDLFCYPAQNPITVPRDNAVEVEIPCYPKNAISDFLNTDTIDPRGRREKERENASLREIPMMDPGIIRARTQKLPAEISGTVSDMKGKPLPGLYVIAYPADIFPYFQMYVVRLITKHIVRTDKDGHYKLDLPGDSSYYLITRERLGEAPVAREYYGLYEGNANHRITANWGKHQADIDIHAARIMPDLN